MREGRCRQSASSRGRVEVEVSFGTSVCAIEIGGEMSDMSRRGMWEVVSGGNGRHVGGWEGMDDMSGILLS